MIERFAPDASGKPTSEGYFAVDARGSLWLMPPGSEMADGLRLATQAEVEAGKATQAEARHMLNYDPRPSGDGA